MPKSITLAMIVLATGWLGLVASAADTTTQPAPAVPIPTVYSVPRLEGIVVDGRADDWGKGGFRVDAMVDAGTGVVRPAADFDPRFRLGWNAQGLLVLVEVDDDVADESVDDSSLFQQDSVELFVATANGGTRLVQVLAAPGIDPQHGELRCKVLDHRSKEAVKVHDLPATSIQIARTATKHGYILEALLPWANLGLTPLAGDEVAFQIFLNDTDHGARTKVMWYPVDGAPTNAACMYRLRLAKAEAGSPAVRVACTAAYERFRRTCVGVVASGDLAGHTAAVFDGKRELGHGVLVADGRRSSVELACPMPAIGKTYGHLTVRVDGKEMASVDLPDANQVRRDGFDSARLHFARSIFSDTIFPACEFEQPGLVEDIIGKYRLHTDFYAADFTPVKTAEKPGRYGAVVTITTDNGAVFKRFVTLFRTAKAVRGGGGGMKGEVTLPPGMGIDPQVVRQQSEAVISRLDQTFMQMSRFTSEPAIFLAALSETKPDSPSRPDNSSAVDQHWWFELKRRTGDFTLYEHKVRLPKDYDADPNARHPLILFLHGSDGTRPNVEKEARNDIAAFADAHPDFPFILVTPACRWKEWWSPDDLGALLDDVAKRYRVDPDRVYLTGLSMGGFGTWSLAAAQPERFAAIVPICGGGDPADAERLKTLPIWIFHGDSDANVPVARSLEMEAALTKAGGKPKLTIYPGVKHNSWTQTYSNPDLYKWLLEQRRGQPAK